MRWVVLLALVADVLATSVAPAKVGTLHHRRLKRVGGRRANGTCKPRNTQFPTYTYTYAYTSVSIMLIPTIITTQIHVPTPTPTLTLPGATTRTVSPSQTPNPAPAPAPGLLAKVLPLGLGSSSNSWTTVQNPGTDSYSLSDTANTLRPTRILGGSLQALGKAPDGKPALEVFFGAGSYAFISGVPGGISFYAYGPTDLTKATELTFGYSVFFEAGFDFVHGGKLPGFYGGSTDDGAISCSGGRHALDCFSARFMWRENGAAELYAYLPEIPANQDLCKNPEIPGITDCGSDYGISFGRGAFSFKTGVWNSVAQRIKLNTPGVANGELQVWYNGKSIWKLTGVEFRGVGMDASVVRGLMVQCFFGGHDAYWQSSKDQRLWLADFSVAQLS